MSSALAAPPDAAIVAAASLGPARVAAASSLTGPPATRAVAA